MRNRAAKHLMGKMKDKRNVEVVEEEKMVGSLWQGGGDRYRGELCCALHPAMTAPAIKDPCLQRS